MTTNKFMGLTNSKDFICYKIHKHKIVALNKKGELISWNLNSGKFIQSVNLNLDFDIKHLTQFHEGFQKNRVLLYSNEDSIEVPLTDVFSND